MSLLDLIYPKRCLGCGVVGDYFCNYCRKIINHKGESLAYVGMVRQAIKEIKYRGTHDLITELVEIWDPPQCDGVVVTCVPMWEPKRRVRGFNQAELIAREVAKKWGVEYKELLRRTRETRPMYGLKLAERSINVRGAFEPMKRGVMPEKVVLIDDVWTSGATLRECERILRKHGAREVGMLAMTR